MPTPGSCFSRAVLRADSTGSGMASARSMLSSGPAPRRTPPTWRRPGRRSTMGSIGERTLAPPMRRVPVGRESRSMAASAVSWPAPKIRSLTGRVPLRAAASASSREMRSRMRCWATVSRMPMPCRETAVATSSPISAATALRPVLARWAAPTPRYVVGSSRATPTVSKSPASRPPASASRPKASRKLMVPSWSLSIPTP